MVDERKAVATNRRARFEYDLGKTMEAGMCLTGTMIKSARSGGMSIVSSHVVVTDGEAWLVGASFDGEAARVKLLLSAGQIVKAGEWTALRGRACIPVKAYFSGKWLKVEIAMAVGRDRAGKKAAAMEKSMRKRGDKTGLRD